MQFACFTWTMTESLLARPVNKISTRNPYKVTGVSGGTVKTVESNDDLDMEVVLSGAELCVRAEEPEDDSSEDMALNLAAEYGDAGMRQTKSCLKISTQKKSLEAVYKESVLARIKSPTFKSHLEDNLEATGHTISESTSSSCFAEELLPCEEETDQEPAEKSGESSSEKSVEMVPMTSRGVSLTAAATVSSSRRPIKCLKWGHCEIRNYDLTIGDNPACLQGAPIQLSWEYDERVIAVPVDEYESKRPPRRKQRQLFLNREVREKMLHEYGYKRADVCRAVRQANVDRNNRKTTVMNLKFTWFYELAESTQKKFRRSACGYTDEREIEKLWQKAEKAALKKA